MMRRLIPGLICVEVPVEARALRYNGFLRCGYRQVVRHQLPKLTFAGSSPVTRSIELAARFPFGSRAFCCLDASCLHGCGRFYLIRSLENAFINKKTALNRGTVDA